MPEYSHVSIDATGRALPLMLLRAKPTLASEEEEANVPPAAISDEVLLQGVRNGDAEAALTLYRRYARLAFTIGFRILKDEGEAEDLAQDMFLRLCAEGATFDGAKGSARTWIIQMLYRRAFDRRAYLHRRHFYSGTDLEQHTNTVVEGRSPEDGMIDRLTAHQLKKAFSELSDRQRETLEAFFFEGLTFAEIAERSGEDVKNVRHHYYRGLERLRQLARQMMRTRKIGR